MYSVYIYREREIIVFREQYICCYIAGRTAWCVFVA